MFVCFKGRIDPLPDESLFAEFPGLLMRQKAIEMVCAHVLQSQEPPPHRGGVLAVLAHINGHKRPKVVINGHRSNFFLINGHKLSQMIINGHKWS